MRKVLVIIVISFSVFLVSCGKEDSKTETDNNSTSGGGSCPSSGCLYVAVGTNGTILTSTDVENWSSAYSGTTNNLYEVEYGNGYFIATGYGGTLLASTDGKSWSKRTSGTTKKLEVAVYGNDIFVVGGEDGTIRTSKDTQIWS